MGEARVDATLHPDLGRLEITMPTVLTLSRVFVMYADIQSLQAGREGRQGLKQPQPNTREEGNLHAIIGALVELMLSVSPISKKPYSAFKTKGDIIEILLERHKNRPGLSERNLQDVFAKGGKRLLD
jgi:hypothetical protein